MKKSEVEMGEEVLERSSYKVNGALRQPYISIYGSARRQLGRGDTEKPKPERYRLRRALILKFKTNDGYWWCMWVAVNSVKDEPCDCKLSDLLLSSNPKNGWTNVSKNTRFVQPFRLLD